MALGYAAIALGLIRAVSGGFGANKVLAMHVTMLLMARETICRNFYELVKSLLRRLTTRLRRWF